MTYTELVRLVAEKVMGWIDINGAYMNRGCNTQEWSGWYRVAPVHGKEWCPLESWDHCMMVVKAMREKGWRFTLRCNSTFTAVSFDSVAGCAKHECNGDDTAQRRVVLEAALQAMEASK